MTSDTFYTSSVHLKMCKNSLVELVESMDAASRDCSSRHKAALILHEHLNKTS